MRSLLIFIATISSAIAYGQDFVYPSIKSTGQSPGEFVPIDWTILDNAYGDLNKDGINDAVIIFQYKDSVLLVNSSEDTVLTRPRILLILFKNPVEKSFALIEQSNSFILKHDNPGMDDPYQELAINNGALGVKFQFFYYTGSWYVTNTTYKFCYQQGQFVLIGADNYSFHRATGDFEDHKYNFLTKKRVLTKGNDNKGTKKVSWKSLKFSQLKTLKSFREPFSWEVEKGVFL